MPTKITTLRKIGAFDGTNKEGKPYVRSVFVDDDGIEWTTFKGQLASQADALVGQTVELEGVETQRGEYVNRNLVSVKAHTNGNAPTVATPDVATLSADSTPNNSPSYEETRQLRIMRQSALDRALTAFGIAGQDPIQSIDEVYDLADEFIDYFVNGASEEA